MHRRQFLQLSVQAAAAVALARAATPSPEAPRRTRFRAIAFDGFPVLDPRPVFALAEELFPGRGAALSDAWKTRQFEYSWLRVAGGHYVDFWQVTEDALVYAAHVIGVELTAEKRARLMDAWLRLKTWPEVLPVLQRFRAAGITCVFLSNFSPRMLSAAVESAGLAGLITQSLSTDAVRTFKPDPRAYQLGVDALGLPVNEILFAAFGGWDASGAKWFGYPTFWVNRLKQPVEELSAVPDGIGHNLLDLERFVFEA
ncbi:MAG: haloacid dehalogenase type II [Candidatus Didemnitutus sp.]|nr:haloacid dehalogenase type II [Candidatus Didemnitutus sp.]